jgi:imidazolonepropionase-like amidohydrolase
MIRLLIGLLALCCLAQDSGESASVLKVGRLLDAASGKYLPDQAVLIRGERIAAIGSLASLNVPKGAVVVDLSKVTVLPGLIDCHTHLMARIPEGPDGYALNLLTKSQAFRALEGAADARLTLRAGFTTVRDVESEGAGYADVALRDAIAQGLVEGPRMLVATRAIAALGKYQPFGVSPDLKDFPTGAQMISGPDEARRAAREQIAGGADLLKVYADWSVPTLTREELRVIVEEAHKSHLKVAAHANFPEAIQNALAAGVDSIEHAHRADRAAIEAIQQKGAFLVPTVGAMFDQLANTDSQERRSMLQKAVESSRNLIRTAIDLNVNIASGYDASSEDHQGHNANEIVALVQLGMTPQQAIRAATENAARLIGWEDRVGKIAPGYYADMIAVAGDPFVDIKQLQHVIFVMKGGEIIRNDVSH